MVNHFRLYLSSKDEQDLQGITMDKYVFMEQNSNILKCWIVFPVKGKLKFELFGRKPTEFVWKVPFKVSILFQKLKEQLEINVLAQKIVNLNGNFKFFGSGCVTTL